MIKDEHIEVASSIELECKLLGRSEKTISKYIYIVTKFLDFTSKQPKDITSIDVKEYLKHLAYIKKSRPNTINLTLSSLKFYFHSCLKHRIMDEFRKVKSGHLLPIILTQEEVHKLLEATSTRRSSFMIQLLYGTGLRVGELCSLRKADLEFSEGIGWVRGGKGGKDRIFRIPSKTKIKLQRYCKSVSSEFVFPGRKGKRLTERAVQRMTKRTALKGGITKRVTPHTMRHTFATHLLNAGVDIRKIQELLGHSNLQTTQIYTYVSNVELKKIKSPLDSTFRGVNL